MRSLMLFKLMIDLFFYGAIFSFLVFFVIGLSTGSFNIGGQSFENMTPTIAVFMIFTVLRPLSFFFAVYHIKRLSESFIKGEIFTDKTSMSLKFIGFGFILYSIVESVGEVLSAHINNHGDTILSANFMGFNSAWFQFTLGLLFLFMDKAFRYANALQQENDLTI